MTPRRLRVIAMGTALLLLFALGVFFLVRLGTQASSKVNEPPSDSSDSSSGPGTGLDSTELGDPQSRPKAGSPSGAGDTGTGTGSGPGNGGPEHRKDGSPNVAGGTGPGAGTGKTDTGNGTDGDPESRKDRGPASAGGVGASDNSGLQPPRPAVSITPGPGLYLPIFSGGEDPPDIAPGEIMPIGVDHTFYLSVQARVIQDPIFTNIQPGNPIIPATPDMTQYNTRECRGATVEPEGSSHPLCTTGIRISDSAAPGIYSVRLELVFEATCTSRTGQPCEALPDQYTPSPDNPINVTWSSWAGVTVEKKV